MTAPAAATAATTEALAPVTPTLPEIRLDLGPVWMTKSAEALALAKDVTQVADDAALEVAGRVQTDLSKLIRDIEQQRMNVTRPLDGLKASIMDKAKELTAPLNAELNRVKALNTAYATRKAQEAEAERKRLLKIQQDKAAADAREALEREERQQTAAQSVFGSAAVADTSEQPQPVNPFAQPPIDPTVVPRAAMPKSSANAFTEVWKFEILDERLVPREFLSVDESKIRAALNYKKSLKCAVEDVAVPGLRIYKEMSVRAR